MKVSVKQADSEMNSGYFVNNAFHWICESFINCADAYSQCSLRYKILPSNFLARIITISREGEDTFPAISCKPCEAGGADSF